VSRRPRGLSEDERVLWSTITRSIAPLKGRKRAEDAAEIAPAETRSTARPAASPAATPPRRTTPPPLAPIDRRTKQRLARGATEIGGRLDLHGLTQAEAHAALARFLHGAQARDVKVVLVITGKGGSDGEGRGVLKRQVPMWLEGAELRSLVIGYDNAGIGHGGAGALYVRVRRGRNH
jgi:DNA-nicking Smr family endonuclease